MAQRTIGARVAILEQKVESLEQLPARIDALELQISQFREEVRVEFVALRGERRAGDEETRGLIRESEEETRGLIRESEEETRRLMRVLHEDVIARLALISEAGNGPKEAGA